MRPLTVTTVLLAGAFLTCGEPRAQTPDPYAGALTDKAQVKVFNKAYKGGDSMRLADAISGLADASRMLPDGGASRTVTKALAKGLESDSPSVRAAAVSALAWGRDPSTVLNAMEELLDDTYTEIAKLTTRRDDESREERREAVDLYKAACKVVAWHKDDRAVEILDDQIAKITRSQQDNDNMAAQVLRPLSEALADLGSREAVEALVKKTRTFVGDRQRVHARKLHDSLSRVSESVGRAPPDYSDTYDQTWHDWLDSYGDKLPKDLGKLDEPTDEPPYISPRERQRMRDKDQSGPRRP